MFADENEIIWWPNGSGCLKRQQRILKDENQQQNNKKKKKTNKIHTQDNNNSSFLNEIDEDIARVKSIIIIKYKNQQQ